MTHRRRPSPGTAGAAPAAGPHSEVSLADITERLMVEFDGRTSVSRIAQVVLGCRHDLRGSPVLVLPELIERSARQRLLNTDTDR